MGGDDGGQSVAGITVLPADSHGEELGGLDSGERDLTACSLLSSLVFLWLRPWLGKVPAAQV